jgi:hypothetical protein
MVKPDGYPAGDFSIMLKVQTLSRLHWPREFYVRVEDFVRPLDRSPSI